MAHPAVSGVPVRFTAGQWVTVGVVAAGLGAYVAALLLDWAGASGEGHRLLDLTARSTVVTSALFVAYLLFPLVGYAMGAAAALAPSRRWSRVAVAAVAALGGLVAVVWLALRISAAGDDVSLGAGWFAGLASVIAAGATAGLGAVGPGPVAAISGPPGIPMSGPTGAAPDPYGYGQPPRP